MKRSFAMRWAKDLLNPRIKQDVGALRTKDGYCCLGRACVVAGLRAKRDHSTTTYKYENKSSELPISVVRKYDIYSEGGSRRDHQPIVIGDRDSRYRSLADANDQGITFKEIAAYIRKNYKYL